LVAVEVVVVKALVVPVVNDEAVGNDGVSLRACVAAWSCILGGCRGSIVDLAAQ